MDFFFMNFLYNFFTHFLVPSINLESVDIYFHFENDIHLHYQNNINKKFPHNNYYWI